MDRKIDRASRLADRIQYLRECCLRGVEGFTGVAEVKAWRNRKTGESGFWDDNPNETLGDADGYAIFTDAYGSLWVLEESEDYTGHGCQCGSSLAKFDSLKKALKLGLSREYRADAAAVLGEEEV